MKKLNDIVLGVVGLGISLVGGVTAVVHINSGPPAKNVQSSSQTDTQTRVVAPAVASASQPQSAATQSSESTDPCQKATVETKERTGSRAVNSSHATIHCESQSKSGSTSIKINDHTQQRAATGKSTGQGGSASNSSDTDVDVDISH